MLSDWVRFRLDRNLAGNGKRFKSIQKVYEEIAGTLANQGIKFAVLKGFSH